MVSLIARHKYSWQSLSVFFWQTSYFFLVSSINKSIKWIILKMVCIVHVKSKGEITLVIMFCKYIVLSTSVCHQGDIKRGGNYDYFL